MPSASTIRTTLGPTDQITGLIAQAASRSGVDFAYLFSQAKIESSFNPNATARTSSASGLFQFTEQTWLGMVKEHGAANGLEWASAAIERRTNGKYWVPDPQLRRPILDLRFDPAASANMAAEFAARNREILARHLNREPQRTDLSLAHFLGPSSACKFLENYALNPDLPAAPSLEKAAAANKTIFFKSDGTARSYREIYGIFARKQSAEAPLHKATNNEFVEINRPAIRVERTATLPKSGSFLDIEVMPKKLSLEFARKAYERIESLHAGTVG